MCKGCWAPKRPSGFTASVNVPILAHQGVFDRRSNCLPHSARVSIGQFLGQALQVSVVLKRSVQVCILSAGTIGSFPWHFHRSSNRNQRPSFAPPPSEDRFPNTGSCQGFAGRMVILSDGQAPIRSELPIPTGATGAIGSRRLGDDFVWAPSLFACALPCPENGFSAPSSGRTVRPGIGKTGGRCV